MADRRFVWEAVFNTSNASKQINQLRDLLRSALTGSKVEIIDKASFEQAKSSARSASASIVEDQKRITIEAKTGSAERIAHARNESALVAQAARAAASTKIEEERRSTQVLRAELRERERAISASARATQQSSARPTVASGGGGGGGIGGALLTGAAAFLTVQTVRQITQGAIEIAKLDTTLTRASKAFDIMSGSADIAADKLKAIKTASGGTVDTLVAIQIGNQAAALGLAKTTGELNDLVRAARAVTFVSPVIRDVQSALTELALASANTSWRRLDQLGLSVTEVRERFLELKAADGSLEDSQAFLQASIESLNSKFGKLLDTTEAQATGVERMQTAWSNFTQFVATSQVGDVIDKILSDAALAVEKFRAEMSGDTSGISNKENLSTLIRKKQLLPPTSNNPLESFESLEAKNNLQIASLQSLEFTIAKVDQAISSGTLGLSGYARALDDMRGAAVLTENVTSAQSTAIIQLGIDVRTAVDAFSNGSPAAEGYAKALDLVGKETLENDATAQGLLASMVTLHVQYINGDIGIRSYRQGVIGLTQGFVNLGIEAGIAATEVALLNFQTSVANAAANRDLYFRTRGTQGTEPPGPVTRKEFEQINGPIPGPKPITDGIFNFQTQFASQQDHQRKIEAEAKRDAAALTRSARGANTAGVKAFNQAQREMEAMLDGIVSVSEVTQQDIDDAKNGNYTDKVDEYLRQLRDEVTNGVDRSSVSIEEAAAGLEKIGVSTVGKSKEAILSLFESAFADLSLFADASNIDTFVNEAAVQGQIDLKEKVKQGRQNIIDHFSSLVDGAVTSITESISGVSSGGGGGVSVGLDLSGIQDIAVKATIGEIVLGEGVTADAALALLDGSSVKATIGSVSLSKSLILPIVTGLTGSISTLQLLASASLPTGVSPSFSGSISTLQLLASASLPEGVTPNVEAIISSLQLLSTASLPKEIYPTIEAVINSLQISSTAVLPEGVTPSIVGSISTLQLLASASLPEQVSPSISALITSLQLSASAELPEGVSPTIEALVSSLQLSADAALSEGVSPTIEALIGSLQLSAAASLPVGVYPSVTGLITTLELSPTATIPPVPLPAAKESPLALSQFGIPAVQDNGAKQAADQYIQDITTELATVDNVLAMANAGIGLRSSIDAGFLSVEASDIGTQYVLLLESQFFTVENSSLLFNVGVRAIELILSGVRIGSNGTNVGDTVVQNIAASVLNAAAAAAEAP